MLVHVPVILDPSGKGKMSKRKVVVAGKEFLGHGQRVYRGGLPARSAFQLAGQRGLERPRRDGFFTREEAIWTSWFPSSKSGW